MATRRANLSHGPAGALSPRLSQRLSLMEHRCGIAAAGRAHSRPDLTGALASV